MTPPERYALLSEALEETVRRKLYSPDLQAAIGSPPDLLAERYRGLRFKDSVNRMLAADLKGFLPDDLLYKMDMATMANSLEARSPFLDHRFVEFAFGIPGYRKVRGLERKAILKRALRGLLPPEILNRPKRGFDPPIACWLREDLKEMVSDLLLDAEARSRSYFNFPFVQTILDKHGRGEEDWAPLLWKLLILEIWHRELG